jgi:RNA polymerase sigma-70 factor, ECF subfamily
MKSSDEIVLAGLRSGDPVAVERWYKQYRPKLARLIQAKVGNFRDVEELVNDTFMSCLRHLPLFRGESSIWTWMQRVAGHEVADYYRKYYAKKTIHALSLEELLLSAPHHDAHHTSELVAQALAKLRPDYRELLLLKYVDKKQVKSIAAELGRSIKSVEADLFRARQAFRVAYET